MQQATSGAERLDTASVSDKRHFEGLQHDQGRPSKRVCCAQQAGGYPVHNQQQQQVDAPGRKPQVFLSQTPQHQLQHEQQLQGASSGQQLDSAAPAGGQDLQHVPWYCQTVNAAATVRVVPRRVPTAKDPTMGGTNTPAQATGSVQDAGASCAEACAGSSAPPHQAEVCRLDRLQPVLQPCLHGLKVRFKGQVLRRPGLGAQVAAAAARQAAGAADAAIGPPGSATIPPPVAAGRQHHASTPCAKAHAGSSAPPAQAEGSSMGCPQQHYHERHHQQQHHQQQQDHAAPAARAGAVAAAPRCSAAAGTGATARDNPCSLTMSELQQRLRGCGCEQGLKALWELAEIFSHDQTAEATGSAGQEPAQRMLQFIADPRQLAPCREPPVQAELDDQYGTTVNFLLGLQQLLAQPVVAAVLGWDSAHQQQRLAEVRSLYSRWQAALAGQQQQQQQQQQQPALAADAPLPTGRPGAPGAAAASALEAHAAPETDSTDSMAAADAVHQNFGGAGGTGSSTGAAAAATATAAAAADAVGCGVAARLPAAAAAAAANAAAAAATPAQLQAGTACTLTVNEAAPVPGRPLRCVLNKWVQAYGILCPAGDAGSVRVAELLPHFAKLLAHLKNLHSSSQLATTTITRSLEALCSFLRAQQRDLQSSSVDYAEMLSSMRAACRQYRQLVKGNTCKVAAAEPAAAADQLCSRSYKAAAAAAVAGPAAAAGLAGIAGPGVAFAAATAAAGPVASIGTDAAALVSAAAGPAAAAGLAGSRVPGVVLAAAAATGSAEGATSSQMWQQLSADIQPLAAEAAAPQAALAAAAGDDAAPLAAAAAALATVGAAGALGASSSSCGALAAAAAAGAAVGCHEQPAPLSEVTGSGLHPGNTETAAGAAVTQQAGAAAATAPLQGSVPDSWTVGNMSYLGTALRSALGRWVRACDIAGDPGSVRVPELLPHYVRLLDFLDLLYSSNKLSSKTVYHYLAALCSLLRDHQPALQSSSVDYAAMLCSMDAAHNHYYRLFRPASTAGARINSTAAAPHAAAAAAAAAAGIGNDAAAVGSVAAGPAATARPAGNAALEPTTGGGAAAATAAGFGEGVTFAQLYQQLSVRCWHGLRVLGGLAQNTHGVTQDSAVAPVLLTYTSPDLLACCRRNASAGGVRQHRATNALEGLQQLLQQPELDAVLGAAVRQQRLAHVNLTLQEVQAAGLQAGGSHNQMQLGANAAVLAELRGGTELLHSIWSLPAGLQGQQEQQQQQTQQQPLFPAAAGAAGGVGSPRLVERFLVHEGSGQLQTATFGNGSYSGGGRSSPPSAAATAGSTLDSGSGAGCSISMADLLQQLQSDPSSKDGWGSACACIRHMHESAACLEGVALDAIPASLLLTNYIAEVGDRAQQCLNAGAVKRQDVGVRAECLALLQEVEGLLQLLSQPVLLQLFGGQRLQELVDGLYRCKQLLTETYSRQ